MKNIKQLAAKSILTTMAVGFFLGLVWGYFEAESIGDGVGQFVSALGLALYFMAALFHVINWSLEQLD